REERRVEVDPGRLGRDRRPGHLGDHGRVPDGGPAERDAERADLARRDLWASSEEVVDGARVRVLVRAVEAPQAARVSVPARVEGEDDVTLVGEELPRQRVQ